jgi:hypothetical protein
VGRIIPDRFQEHDVSTPQKPPPFDPAHPQVGQVPAWLTTGKHKGPNGDLLIITMRVANATLTAVMTKADGENWIKQIQEEISDMSSLTIAPPGMALPPMGQNGHPG